MDKSKAKVRHHKNRVFGVTLGSKLLYETLSSNPSKSLRAYRRTGRNDRSPEMAEFEMRRCSSSEDTLTVVRRMLSQESRRGGYLCD